MSFFLNHPKYLLHRGPHIFYSTRAEAQDEKGHKPRQACNGMACLQAGPKLPPHALLHSQLQIIDFLATVITLRLPE